MQQNCNKIKMPIAFGNHAGVGFSFETGQVEVKTLRAELKKMGIVDDVFEFLDAAPCKESYGMVKPGFDSRLALFAPDSLWAVVFGWNSTSDLWAVVQFKTGDAIPGLVRMAGGGIGTIRTVHATQESAEAALKEAYYKIRTP